MTNDADGNQIMNECLVLIHKASETMTHDDVTQYH